MTEYQNLKTERKKAIAQNANEWLKKNRVGLISNVRPETRQAFDEIHEKLLQENKVNSREDTVNYLCRFFNENH